MIDRTQLERLYRRYKIEELYGIPFTQFVVDLIKVELPQTSNGKPNIASLVRELVGTYKANRAKP